jgi:hypothetical protein
VAVTTVGFAEISGLVGNTGSKTAFTYLGTGSGSTIFAASQTALVSENTGTGIDRKSATVSQTTTDGGSNNTLTLSATWVVAGATTIREVAVFNGAYGGSPNVMGARSVLAANKVLAALESYALTYNIKFA